MEDLGIWKTVKIGFWLGIGFIVPHLVAFYSGTMVTMFAIPSMMEENLLSDFDKSEQIKVIEHREEMNGERLIILGSILNEGNETASSIQLEAELLNSDGQFVFECSSYIKKISSQVKKRIFRLTVVVGTLMPLSMQA
ncbi:MAG: hypothetical protein ABW157_02105 [Candidatus Thiodiazotropha sp. LLP2]